MGWGNDPNRQKVALSVAPLSPLKNNRPQSGSSRRRAHSRVKLVFVQPAFYCSIDKRCLSSRLKADFLHQVEISGKHISRVSGAAAFEKVPYSRIYRGKQLRGAQAAAVLRVEDDDAFSLRHLRLVEFALGKLYV